MARRMRPANLESVFANRCATTIIPDSPRERLAADSASAFVPMDDAKPIASPWYCSCGSLRQSAAEAWRQIYWGKNGWQQRDYILWVKSDACTSECASFEIASGIGLDFGKAKRYFCLAAWRLAFLSALVLASASLPLRRPASGTLTLGSHLASSALVLAYCGSLARFFHSCGSFTSS